MELFRYLLICGTLIGLLAMGAPAATAQPEAIRPDVAKVPSKARKRDLFRLPHFYYSQRQSERYTVQDFMQGLQKKGEQDGRITESAESSD